jgi:DNA-binding response OmpR family regulator
MTAKHRALIVEDDAPTAEDLADIVTALDCEPVVVDNKADAVAALERDAFCFALFDLHVKTTSDSIRGSVEAGHGLVRDARRLYSDHAGAGGSYRMPILVVSGHAREVADAVAVMKDGADDVIQKPLDIRGVSERIREALARSGRSSHEMCATMGRGYGASGALIISFPGERVGRRNLVVVRGRPIKLTDGMLRILLQLVVAKLSERAVHKIDLGATEDQGFKRISELRKELERALGDDVNIIDNDYQGNYGIAVPIALGECDLEKLAGIGDRKIAALAEQLRAHRGRRV